MLAVGADLLCVIADKLEWEDAVALTGVSKALRDQLQPHLRGKAQRGVQTLASLLRRVLGMHRTIQQTNWKWTDYGNPVDTIRSIDARVGETVPGTPFKFTRVWDLLLGGKAHMRVDDREFEVCFYSSNHHVYFAVRSQLGAFECGMDVRDAMPRLCPADNARYKVYGTVKDSEVWNKKTRLTYTEKVALAALRQLEAERYMADQWSVSCK